jgi:hypothetical protein
VFRRLEPEPESQLGARARGHTDWRNDRSGYDGWLAPNGDGPLDAE